jgi:hypothetical protein
MKKLILRTPIFLLFSVLMMPLITRAQTDEKIWSFGPEVGLNVTKFGGDESESDYRTGIALGLGVTYSVQNTYGLTTKVLYSQRGAKNGDMKISMKYIEVPIMGRFFLNRDGVCRPNIFVGPSFNFLTGVSSKLNDGDNVEDKDFKDTYNTFDFGLTGGIGLNWLIGNETRIIIDGRYTHGLSDIAKSDSDVFNRGFTISAGITFGLQ